MEPGHEDEAAAERSIRDQVGGITAPSRGLSASSLQAEKRLSDLRAVMDELGRLLTKMEDIVIAAKRTAGSYRSQELLLRGRFGAQQSVMDRLHLMAECLGLHQSEYELKESIVGSLTFSMSSLTLTTHLMAWKAKPFAGEWQRTAASVGSS